MRRHNSSFSVELAAVVPLIFAAGLFLGLASRTWAADEETAKPAAESKEPQPEASDSSGGEESGQLDSRQENVSRRFKQFEKTLLQMAEYLRKTEPERADLLLRARRKSQEDRVAQQMEQIISLLRSERLGDAVERQSELVTHLRAMLELLQSEDRRSEIEKEKARINDLLKNLNQITARQKDVRAQTERGAEPGPLADKQLDISGDAKKLAEKIERQDAERNGEPAKGADQPGKPGEKPNGKDSQNQNPDQPKKDQKKDESPEKDRTQKSPPDSKDPKSKPGDQKPGNDGAQPGKPQEGQPGDQQEGEQGDSQEGESQENQSGQQETEQKKTPGRDEIEQAHKEMEQAIEKLKKLNRDGASSNQDEAIRKLQKAKEKLEEILRQLREEERELMLTALEARFQKMLAQELLVLEGTTTLDKTPKAEWTARHFGRSRELAVDQDAIALDSAKALTLLREEGSSVAFPEGVEQIRDDMLSAVRLLQKNEVGELTQGIERDIVEALQEMIEALQKEIEKKKSDPQQQQPGQQGQKQDKPLVEQIAELKMLRSLQLRINRRTRRLGGMIKGEQATDADVVDQLRSLSFRQAQVQQATHDLATGKNR